MATARCWICRKPREAAASASPREAKGLRHTARTTTKTRTTICPTTWKTTTRKTKVSIYHQSSNNASYQLLVQKKKNTQVLISVGGKKII